MLAPVGGSDAAKTKLRKSKKKKKKQEVIRGGRDQFFVFFSYVVEGVQHQKSHGAQQYLSCCN